MAINGKTLHYGVGARSPLDQDERRDDFWDLPPRPSHAPGSWEAPWSETKAEFAAETKPHGPPGIDGCRCPACDPWNPRRDRPNLPKSAGGLPPVVFEEHPLYRQQPTAAIRKGQPVASGVLDYFPDALLAVAELSRVGNEQHNPGMPLHWAKEKSMDEADALMRHLIDRGTLDTDGIRHSAKVAWRGLALLQREIEAERSATTPR